MDDAEVGEELATVLDVIDDPRVGVERELSVADAVVVDGFGDELFGEGGAPDSRGATSQAMAYRL